MVGSSRSEDEGPPEDQNGLVADEQHESTGGGSNILLNAPAPPDTSSPILEDVNEV
jgi:hypothetical protein